MSHPRATLHELPHSLRPDLSLAVSRRGDLGGARRPGLDFSSRPACSDLRSRLPWDFTELHRFGENPRPLRSVEAPVDRPDGRAVRLSRWPRWSWAQRPGQRSWPTICVGHLFMRRPWLVQARELGGPSCISGGGGSRQSEVQVSTGGQDQQRGEGEATAGTPERQLGAFRQCWQAAPHPAPHP